MRLAIKLAVVSAVQTIYGCFLYYEVQRGAHVKVIWPALAVLPMLIAAVFCNRCSLFGRGCRGSAAQSWWL